VLQKENQKNGILGNFKPIGPQSCHVFNAGPAREVNEINSSFLQVVCYVAKVIPQVLWALSASCW
jgi:hypothetical protein